MSALCPLLRDERKCLERPRKSESDPTTDISTKFTVMRDRSLIQRCGSVRPFAWWGGAREATRLPLFVKAYQTVAKAWLEQVGKKQ
jgi:hypothetical protein